MPARRVLYCLRHGRGGASSGDHNGPWQRTLHRRNLRLRTGLDSPEVATGSRVDQSTLAVRGKPSLWVSHHYIFTTKQSRAGEIHNAPPYIYQAIDSNAEAGTKLLLDQPSDVHQQFWLLSPSLRFPRRCSLPSGVPMALRRSLPRRASISVPRVACIPTPVAY